MRFKVLVADDEYFIRQRIKKIIPWDTLNLDFAGEVDNGQSAVDFMRSQPVDIVLLDIKMPQLSGIEVAKIVHEQFPLVKIIILSGHNDFEYARVAMRYGVVDFLLKPVDPAALQETLYTCIGTLSAQIDQRSKFQKLKYFERHHDVADVLDGRLEPDSLIERHPELAAKSHLLFTGCFVITPAKDFMPSLESRLKVLQIEFEIFKESEYSYLLIFFLANPAESVALAQVMAEISQPAGNGSPDSAIEACPDAEYLFLAMAEPCELHADWQDGYDEAVRALDQRYFMTSHFFQMAKHNARQMASAADVSKIRQLLLLALVQNDPEALRATIGTIFTDLRNRAVAEDLSLVIAEIMMTYRVHFGDRYVLAQSLADAVSQLISEDYRLDSLKETVLDQGLQCLNPEKHAPSDIRLCRRIAQYIGENYPDMSLSVAQLSVVFQMNASYLGYLFKKVYNQSLVQYITQIRLEAARRLLANSQARLADIAGQVGYADVFYFSKKFKKQFGLSPKSYILSLGHQDPE